MFYWGPTNVIGLFYWRDLNKLKKDERNSVIESLMLEVSVLNACRMKKEILLELVCLEM